MRDQQDNDDTRWTSEAFEKWLTETARAENLTEQEVIHRMMASFWVLSEFEDLVGNDAATSLPDLDDALRPSAGGSDWISGRGPDATDEPDAPLASDSLGDYVDAFATYLDERAAPPADGSPEDNDAAGVEGFKEHLDAVETTVEDLGGRHEALRADHEELADDHEELADRVDSDFKQVEKILKRLVSRSKDHAGAIDQLEEKVTSLHEHRRTGERHRNRLAGLLQAAHEHGVESGKCQDCGGTVALGLLTDAECPHCGIELVGVRPGGWFQSNVVTTANRDQTPERARRRTNDAANQAYDSHLDEAPLADEYVPPVDDQPQSTNERDWFEGLDSDDAESAADDADAFEWVDQ